MFTSLALLTVVGGVFRFGCGVVLRRFTGRVLCVPQAFALMLVVFTGLPDLLKPFSMPIPFGVVLGFLLPDLLSVRRL